MAVIFDAHTHLYQGPKLTELCRQVHRNFDASLRSKGPVKAACARALLLTERQGCEFFAELASGRRSAADLQVNILEGGAAIELITDDRPPLTVLPGRQILSAERIELHALLSRGSVPDGYPLSEAIQRVRDIGGIVVLPWALGKWFGLRGEVVEQELVRSPATVSLCSDPALRPHLCPLPRLYTAAGERNIRLVYGTDPLPLPGDEKRIGTYATYHPGHFDSSQPSKELRRILLEAPQGELLAIGRRISWLGFAVRFAMLKATKVSKSSVR